MDGSIHHNCHSEGDTFCEEQPLKADERWVMCSDRRILKISRAAACCTDWRRWMRLAGSPRCVQDVLTTVLRLFVHHGFSYNTSLFVACFCQHDVKARYNESTGSPAQFLESDASFCMTVQCLPFVYKSSSCIYAEKVRINLRIASHFFTRPSFYSQNLTIIWIVLKRAFA